MTPVFWLRLLVMLLVLAAILLAAVPLVVLLDLARGGSGFGLCPAGVDRCRSPYTAAPELSTALTVGLFVVLAALRLAQRALRRMQRRTVPPAVSELR